MHDLAELLKALAVLKDPLIIVLTLVIVGLFLLIREDRKVMSEKDACIREFLESSAQVSEALIKLSTLVEVVVYGRNQK